MAMHLVVYPLTGVLSTVSPLVDSRSIDVVLNKSAVERGAICPLEFALAMLLSVLVASRVL